MFYDLSVCNVSRCLRVSHFALCWNDIASSFWLFCRFSITSSSSHITAVKPPFLLPQPTVTFMGVSHAHVCEKDFSGIVPALQNQTVLAYDEDQNIVPMKELGQFSVR